MHGIYQIYLAADDTYLALIVMRIPSIQALSQEMSQTINLAKNNQGPYSSKY